jgi:hypothetical protein
MSESRTAVALVTGGGPEAVPRCAAVHKKRKASLDRKAPHILCSKCESCFEFDEELGQFSLPVRLGLLEHALQMDAHSRKPDTQLVGHKLQAMPFQHKKSDPGLGLRQIEDVAEVVWLQLRLTSVVDY